jgi:hypothetical protein
VTRGDQHVLRHRRGQVVAIQQVCGDRHGLAYSKVIPYTWRRSWVGIGTSGATSNTTNRPSRFPASRLTTPGSKPGAITASVIVPA